MLRLLQLPLSRRLAWWARVAVATPLAVLLSCAGCAPALESAGDREAEQQALSREDRLLAPQLAEVAERDTVLDTDAESVDCWAPSDHMIDDSQFRVICRVHYEQAGQSRYRDLICVGDLTRTPVVEYCYEWAPYSDTPAFEDYPAFALPR